MKGSRASAAHGRGGRAIGFDFVSIALVVVMSTSNSWRDTRAPYLLA
jgi:hypothetical protein